MVLTFPSVAVPAADPVLRSTDLFRNIDPGAAAALAADFETVHAERGTVLFAEETPVTGSSSC